ncbi:four-carbon acid sugar kinase family protein [Spirillospora sp. NPDC029432]|uniref:four-carbon acid sugar kinase family protein n=1 Tax=Spirillospora sp. NPDC029432 TaxID=3154599 RepID=UPI00345348CD
MTEIVIVADDLTGAADSAVPFAARMSTAVALESAWPRARAVAVDTDSRYSPEDVATERVAKAVTRGIADGARIVKKIDSTLRGNAGPEIAAAVAAAGGPLAVVAPAFPATGRTVAAGIVRVGGEPLPGRRYGGDVAALLAAAGLTARRLDLGAVRGGDLAARFAQARADGLAAVVCDGETMADLEAVCAAAGEGTLLVGSGGVTAALARTAGPAEPAAVRAPAGPALAVIGSYSGLARDQRATLVAEGWTPVTVAPGAHDAAAAAEAVRNGLKAGDVVLSVDPDAPVDRDRAYATARSLAAAAAGAAGGAGILLATGGETARAVLLELGATELWPAGEPEPGVVAGRVQGTGTLFITKAGAFGDPATLARVVRAVRATA